MKKIKVLLAIATILITAISTVTADFPDPDPVIAGGFDTTGVFIFFTVFIGSLYTFSKTQRVGHTN